MPLPQPAFDSLLSELPRLSPKQAMVVKDHFSLLFKESATNGHWLLDGACRELKRRGIMSSYVPPMIRLQSMSKDLNLQLKGLEQFLLDNIGNMNPAEKSALADICFMTLCEWLKERRLVLSLRMVILNLDNVPRALDCAFPGWIAAGVLGCLLKRGKQGGHSGTVRR